ncbi:hypothetical protein [Flavobacterium sp.]|uniref:hypothetical protein n=1 Tax=Flavobacterium sp. TaxID=239 RepID=UPI00261AEF43|nr:hypothetical protein [Flavobacterium sp.]MDD2986300.1 hypothetical protein [Flavobacterium sp.]
MKKITLILVLIGMITLQGCTIEENSGYDNDTFSKVFEVTRSFSPQNDFSSLITFNPPIFSSDVVLVYILWDVQNDGTPVWRLMPQTVQLFEGDLQYNYDFTRFDVNLFISSLDFDVAFIDPVWTQNQTFRIVLVPASFGGKMDYTNYENVMQKLKLSEKDVKSIK